MFGRSNKTNEPWLEVLPPPHTTRLLLDNLNMNIIHTLCITSLHPFYFFFSILKFAYRFTEYKVFRDHLETIHSDLLPGTY